MAFTATKVWLAILAARPQRRKVGNSASTPESSRAYASIYTPRTKEFRRTAANNPASTQAAAATVRADVRRERVAWLVSLATLTHLQGASGFGHGDTCDKPCEPVRAIRSIRLVNAADVPRTTRAGSSRAVCGVF